MNDAEMRLLLAVARGLRRLMMERQHDADVVSALDRALAAFESSSPVAAQIVRETK